MAKAVFRVKRRIEDEPYDTFVLNCKRFKSADEHETPNTCSTSIDGEDISRTFLKFAATLKDEEDIGVHLSKIQKSDAEQHVSKVRKPSNVMEKIRQQYKNDTQNQRFKIVDGIREIETDIITNNNDVVSRVTVIDIVKEAAGQLPSLDADVILPADDSSVKFVYDLYLFDNDMQPKEWNIETISSIQPHDDLVYQTQDETLDNSDIDSEDSNDEANWRNDYPDTEEDSIGEDDMRRAMAELNVANGSYFCCCYCSFDSHTPFPHGLLFFSLDESISDTEVLAYGQEKRHTLDTSNDDSDNDDDDDYVYFKKFGRMKMHSEHYRKSRNMRRNEDSDDEDSCNDDSDRSSVSELISCDDDD